MNKQVGVAQSEQPIEPRKAAFFGVPTHTLLTGFASPELETKIREMFKTRLNLKRTSLNGYTFALARFCNSQKIEPFDFAKVGLERVEEAVEQFIRNYQNELSPKYLNTIYCAVKSWCFCTRMIKSRKLFREVKFDKSSRKVDAITELSLETSHIKKLVEMADIDGKILIGLYGFAGLRPVLIPRLTVGDFAANDYTLQNGKIHFVSKNPFLFVRKELEGNKAHIKFFTILPSKVAELLETVLNSADEPVTLKTPLLRKHGSAPAIYQKVVQMFAKIGFVGRPYLLRSYADKLLDRNLACSEASGEKRDTDLKEFMMGHKGTIAAVYQFRALSEEDAKQYRKMFESVDKWLNVNVFGIAAEDDYNRAKMQCEVAVKFGASQERMTEMLALLNVGKMTMQAFDAELSAAIDMAQKRNLENRFDALFKAYQATHAPQ